MIGDNIIIMALFLFENEIFKSNNNSNNIHLNFTYNKFDIITKHR
jgi:hypothetical protein